MKKKYRIIPLILAGIIFIIFCFSSSKIKGMITTTQSLEYGTMVVDVKDTSEVNEFYLFLNLYKGNDEYEVVYNASVWSTTGDTTAEGVLAYEEDIFFIPISYFTETYQKYGYIFEEDNCPFYYAPNAYNQYSNLVKTEYAKIDNRWYVKVQDTTGLDPHRINIIYNELSYYPYQEIESVNHPNSVINLFDYWTSYENDIDVKVNNITGGVNENHALKFTHEGSQFKNIGSVNTWTGGTQPYQGIVKNTLVDGYPVLSGDPDIFEDAMQEYLGTGSTTESLKYLFDPNQKASYKKSYRNVNGLLQLDKDGYYYYNSQKNYTTYDSETNTLLLYNNWGIYAGGTSPDGQFFPFNSLDETDATSTDSNINHYFGFTLFNRFLQSYDGWTNATHTTPTVFEFAGDDDVWIFIDNVLVADLGGIHDRASVDINFATGEVKINGKISTIKEAYEKAGMVDTTDWEGNTFANNTVHTLKFFYLERGNVDSNLELKYNLSDIPDTSIYKVDQYGEDIEGATFAVYKTNENYLYEVDNQNRFIDLEENTYEIDEKTGIITLSTGETITPKYIGQTNKQGEMIFTDEDELPYSITELEKIFGTKFILREIAVPEGYRKTIDEIHLYIVKGAILCDNTYASGVWSSTTALIKAPSVLELEEKGTTEYFNFDNNKINGTLFAVILKRVSDEGSDPYDSQGTWNPIYGNDISGYTTVPIKEDLVTSVIEAANKANEFGNSIFGISQTGALQVELENMPGNILNYYYMMQQLGKETSNSEYTIAYYWTLSNLENATKENTYRVKENNSQYGDFEITFGATIEIPNILNRLFVQKINEKNELINGATFALYNVIEDDDKIYYLTTNNEKAILDPTSQKAYINNQEGTYEITYTGDVNIKIANETYTISPATNALGRKITCQTLSIAEENNETGENGTCSMTNLLDGTYYLKEIHAPDGYKINNAETMVLVDDQTIYVNAGTTTDGVSVARGIGYVVPTLNQFTSENNMDNTLTWLYTVLKINTENINTFTLNETNWNYAQNRTGTMVEEIIEAMHTYLKYNPSSDSSIFEYTVNEDVVDKEQNMKEVRLYTDTGWSILEVYQDTSYGEQNLLEGTSYTKLDANENIANVFSQSIYVQITDEKIPVKEENENVVNPNTKDIIIEIFFAFIISLGVIILNQHIFIRKRKAK